MSLLRSPEIVGHFEKVVMFMIKLCDFNGFELKYYQL